MFPVDFPFNQSSDFSEMMQWIEVVQHTHQSSSDSIHDQLPTDTHNRLGVLLHCLCFAREDSWRVYKSIQPQQQQSKDKIAKNIKDPEVAKW